MDLQFKVGDRVRLTREAVALYGGVPGQWIPEGQGSGTDGIVAIAEDRPHDPRAAARPYMVLWANGVVNSYREDDLELAEAPTIAPKEPEPEVGGFKFKVITGEED